MQRSWLPSEPNLSQAKSVSEAMEVSTPDETALKHLEINWQRTRYPQKAKASTYTNLVSLQICGEAFSQSMLNDDVASTLVSNTNLTKLSICSKDETLATQSVILAQPVFDAICSNTTLTHLKISQTMVDAAVTSFSNLTKLEHLVLQDVCLREVEGYAFVQLIGRLPRLKSLMLTNYSMVNSSLNTNYPKHAVLHIQSLEFLGVADIFSGSETACTALTNNTHLRELFIHNYDYGITNEIKKAVSENHTLVNFGTQFPDKDKSHVIKSITRNRKKWSEIFYIHMHLVYGLASELRKSTRGAKHFMSFPTDIWNYIFDILISDLNLPQKHSQVLREIWRAVINPEKDTATKATTLCTQPMRECFLFFGMTSARVHELQQLAFPKRLVR